MRTKWLIVLVTPVGVFAIRDYKNEQLSKLIYRVDEGANCEKEANGKRGGEGPIKDSTRVYSTLLTLHPTNRKD